MARTKTAGPKPKPAPQKATKAPTITPRQIYALRAFVLSIGTIMVLVLWWIGRGEHRPIESFTTPKTDTHRTMAAVVLRSFDAWFFKLHGPLKDVGVQRTSFREFVGSLEFDTTTSRPTWKLPDGWKQLPDDAPQNQGSVPRFATLEIPNGDKPMELTVIRLNVPPSADERYIFQYLLMNINRWRSEVRQEPIGLSDILEETEIVELGTVKAMLVQIDGVVEDKTLPFEVPKGWNEAMGNQFSKYAYEKAEDGEQLEITVSILNESDTLANVNRWRRQIGMDALGDDEALKKIITTIEMQDAAGSYVELKGESETILGVIATHKGQSWFIKLRGPSKMAEREKKTFESFVKSFKLSPSSGASDGD